MKYSRLGREETGWVWTCLGLVGGKREVRVRPLVPFGSPGPVPGSLVRSPYVDMRYAHSIRAFGARTLTTLPLVSSPVGDFSQPLPCFGVIWLRGALQSQSGYELNVMNECQS